MKPLSLEQLKINRQKALANARELIEEAQFLFEKGHWARVIFLC
jgi:AbiV family abortive infection protein